MVALVGGVAVLAILVVEGVSLPFLALLAGSAWLLYDGITGYRADESPDATSPVDHE